MQDTRSGPGVRFASESSRRSASVASTTETTSKLPSPAGSSIVSIPEPPLPVAHARARAAATSTGLYEIWEPPEETVLDHYKPLPGPTGGARLGKVIGAALRAQFSGKPFESPRISLARSRSVVSESDASTISRDELLVDARRLGLPLRAPHAAPPRTTTTVPRTTIPRTTAPPTTVPRTTIPRATVPRATIPRTTVPRTTIPRTAPPRSTATTRPIVTPPAAPTPPAIPTPPPAPTSAPPLLTSHTMATALTPSPTNSWGAPLPINSSTYKVWRASIARTNMWSGTSPYTKMLDDAAYKPKPMPPSGTIIESSGEGIFRAEKALYALLSTRPVDERIFWTMPPDHDERVRNTIKAVDGMSRELALYGLDQYLAHGTKGAIMTNAGYHAPEWPESPAYDWITFHDARKTGDQTLQESIAYSDPGLTTIVFIFLVSRSGESMAIWRRKFTVPPSERLRRDLDLRRAALDAQKRGEVYSIDLNPLIMVPDELIVVTPAKKKRRKFPWFKVDWGRSTPSPEEKETEKEKEKEKEKS